MTAAPTISTDRLVLRAWRVDDAEAALAVYGHPDVARWLSPAMDRVQDVSAMERLLRTWMADDAELPRPAGRWAIEHNTEGVIGGVILLPLPPGDEDLEIGWQLRPDQWGNGYATETTHALAEWAFEQDIDEIFAVVRPGNTRAAATVRANGMQWVGETTKYFGLNLQVFRLRSADLDRAAPHAPHPPNFARG